MAVTTSVSPLVYPPRIPSPELSVVIPICNEEKTISLLYDRLTRVLEGAKIRPKDFSWANIAGRFLKLVDSDLISTLSFNVPTDTR